MLQDEATRTRDAVSFDHAECGIDESAIDVLNRPGSAREDGLEISVIGFTHCLFICRLCARFRGHSTLICIDLYRILWPSCGGCSR